jgi:hypothetical protein
VSEKIIKRIFTPDTKFCPRCDFKKSCPHSTARK